MDLPPDYRGNCSNCLFRTTEILRARTREYSVLSTDALRVLLAARGVYAELDKQNRSELIRLAVLTHDCAGDQGKINERLSRLKNGPGPIMIDIII